VEDKMKNLLVATALFVTFAGAILNAQSTRLYANIPFDFQMGKTPMPAGEYTFQRQSGVLSIRSADGKHGLMTLTSPASRREITTQPLVQFQRYGDSYFLSGLWNADSRDGFTLQGVKQRELAKSLQTPDTTVIALSRH
jgi:hypothetical protein